MNTNQTNETSWVALDAGVHECFVIPSYDEASLRDVLQLADSAAIEFRVTRAGSPTRRMRLTGDRYTFGTGEGCSIQLSDADLSPMHAVLIRTGNRTIVRGCSAPVVVNEQRVSEADLQLGDVLKLGAYQFELCSAVAEPVGETPDAMIRDERIRQDLEQLRELQADCDRRNALCDQRETIIDDRECELELRSEALEKRETLLQAKETDQIEQTDVAVQYQQELVNVRQELNRRQEDFHQREREFRTQESEFRKRFNETNRQLRRSQKQADAANEAVARMREQFDQLNQQIEELSTQQIQIETRAQEQHRAEIDRLQNGLAERDVEAESLRKNVQQLQQKLQSSSDALSQALDKLNELGNTNLQLTTRLEELERQEPPKSGDPQLSSIWRDQEWDQERLEESLPVDGAGDSEEFRLEELEEGQYDFIDDATMVVDSVEIGANSDHSDSDRVQVSQAHVTSAGSADSVDDDDSIEAYMNRLLRRVQGKPLDEVVAPPPVTPNVKPPTPAVKAVEPPKETKPANRLDPNAPLVPRSQAPEKGTSLSAMRELANASARIAINRSVEVQTRDTQLRAAFSIACAFGAAICGIACYLLLPGIMRYLSVVMTTVVAGIYVYEGWRLYREANRLMPSEGEPADTPSEE